MTLVQQLAELVDSWYHLPCHTSPPLGTWSIAKQYVYSAHTLPLDNSLQVSSN